MMGRPRNPPPAVGDDLDALMAIWAEYGPGAIRSIRTADPIAFIRLVAMAGALDDDADKGGEPS